ncbi:alpha/beta fold hydrolase [Nocardioides cynanchi]|uniref:alpha/beta fold hydrolase n=1 Tax=Nocardioides cynanchi TaxID=2558918 RepID=UPI001248A276|nr:alpha/beta hydrolase [Nocardioides cynanchi]
MDALARWNVHQSGQKGGPVLLFAHGFGCDQHMWRFVTPAFEDRFRVVRFDFVGSGGSDLTTYDVERYSTLQGYADDVVSLCTELDLTDVTYVGHSVAAMIGVLAEVARPELFAQLVLVGPSPRYIDTDGYRGGFSADDIEQLLGSLDSNYLGWSGAMAPVIMGNAERPHLGAELTASFCRTDPEIARRFARVTFTSDNRAELGRVTTPTLILQCRDDVIAPLEVGAYVRDAIPGSTMTVLEATGHCPNLSAPEETVAAMADFVRGR